MREDPNPGAREVIDLTRETDVAYWCRIFNVSIDELRDAVQHAGHEPAEVRRHLEQRAADRPPGR